MGMKEKMMDKMIDKMDSDEKQEMMDSMMGKFFDGMSEEEKSTMMQSMMGKMMGGGAMGGMMGMMMGQKGSEKAVSPMDMCQKMMKGIDNAQVQANYATPELRGLFEEWIVQIEEEIYEFYQGKEKINLQEAEDYFHLKEESIQYILTRLTQKGKLEIKPF